jgi:hypothetical protein
MRVLCTIGTRIRSRNTTSNIVLWPFSYGIKTIQILHLYHSNMVFWSFLYDTQTQGWSWAWAQRATTRLKKTYIEKTLLYPCLQNTFWFPSHMQDTHTNRKKQSRKITLTQEAKPRSYTTAPKHVCTSHHYDRTTSLLWLSFQSHFCKTLFLS